MTSSDAMVVVEDLGKVFTLHAQGGAVLPVLAGLDLTVVRGECVALMGPSGVGKSTLLRCIYGNYQPRNGSIRVRHAGMLTEVVGAQPRVILDLRRRTLGYASQFLRVIPRVDTLRLVMEPLLGLGVAREQARERAAALLERLRIPQRLWSLAPATFSGGEQQRVNIARTLVVEYPVLLLDEPTASLDPVNRRTVIELIEEARERGGAMIGIFHDQEVREAAGTRLFHFPPLHNSPL